MRIALRNAIKAFQITLKREFKDQIEPTPIDPEERDRQLALIQSWYFRFITGRIDENGKDCPCDVRYNREKEMQSLLADHLHALTGNCAFGMWIKKQKQKDWQRILWDMYDFITPTSYLSVLTNFTKAAIVHYLLFLKDIYGINWDQEEATKMYDESRDSIIRFANANKTYWTTFYE